MEVQDPLKWTVRSLRLGQHPPCQVERHWWIALRCLNGDVQDPEHIDLGQEQVSEVVRNPLQNHDRMDSGRRYCLLTMIHEATHQGHRALLKSMWNPASIADMMSDNLDITEAVVLDHITAISYMGR